MVAHEVGVLGEVDGLEGEAAEALPPVDGLILGGGGAAAAGLRAPLAIHGVHSVCGSPLPLEPTTRLSLLLGLFWWCGRPRSVFLVVTRKINMSAKEGRVQAQHGGPLKQVHN